MTLSAADKKHYRTIAHNLNPVVMIGDKGLTDSLMDELFRALRDHELIKIKIAVGDRDDRAQLIEQILQTTQAEMVQKIGKIIVILRKNPKAKPKLSNLVR